MTAYNWKERQPWCRRRGRRRDGEHTSCKPALISQALCHSVEQHMAMLVMSGVGKHSQNITPSSSDSIGFFPKQP